MQAISPGEARTKSATGPMGRIRLHDYIGTSASASRGPQAFVVEMLEPDAKLDAHFHDVDQFQVVVAGRGKLGRHDIEPITVHYADAFSPYGPILGSADGLSYLTLRLNAAGGFWPMPGSRDQMKTRPGRQFTVSFRPEPGTEGAQVETLSERFDDGLSVKRLRLSPDAGGEAPGEAGCGGYLLVCAGSVSAGGAECPTSSVLMFERGEGPPALRAGPQGADLLVLTFPRPSDRIGSRPSEADAYTPPAGLSASA